MSFSKKIAKSAAEKASKGFVSPEDTKFLEGKPSRIEVANYVNGLLEDHYLPKVTNYIQMSSMILQAILIEKGVCTGDEIKEVTERFVKENQRRIRDTKTLNDAKNLPDRENLENGLVDRLSDALTKQFWKDDVSEDEAKSIYTSLYGVLIDLLNVHLNASDKDLMDEITEELPSLIEEVGNLKAAIDGETIAISNKDNRETLLGLLTDALERLEKGLSLEEETPKEE